MWHKEAFIAKERNPFNLMGKKLDYLHLKDFLNCENLYPYIISLLHTILIYFLVP